ncbi:hypothetical protein FAP59_18105 [Morganella morganii]|nr:hypothetical protein [Morganella morganii]
MKIPVFTVTGVMACLMLLSSPVNAQTTASATFNLQAELKRATCEPALTPSWDADSAGNVDFGILTKTETNEVKKKQVVLTLTCDSASPPMVAGIGFKVVNGWIGSEKPETLFPKYDDLHGLVFATLFFGYEFAWGSEINQTVVKASEGGYAGLSPGEKVNLAQETTGRQYLLVQKEGKVTWDFPLDITLTPDTSTYSYFLPGDYTAAVRVNISYE